MNQFYIYSYSYLKKSSDESGEEILTSATVIFCENDINIANLQTEIKTFYETNTQTDEIFVFGGAHIKKSLIATFEANAEETFRYIPKAHQTHLKDHLFVFFFDESGKLTRLIPGKEEVNELLFRKMLNEGMLQIFINRGGLIEAKDSHHYVFPSGKHCNKFLRTGNILLHSSEIYFIAFNLLSSLDHDEHRQIFCDTSSINTLAFALVDLKRRLLFDNNKKYAMPSIESFSSYEGIVKADGKRLENSLLLISASTSGNILERIVREHPIVKEKDISILFFLGAEQTYLKNKDHILCVLTQLPDNPTGIPLYPTYNSTSCQLCKAGSHPVMISGDILLPENPKINRIIFSVKDVPPYMGKFVKEFSSIVKQTSNVLKVNYKETAAKNLKYEIYFDFMQVIQAIRANEEKYKQFKRKLDDFIDQYVPSNVKYFLCLPDEGSKELSVYLLERIKNNYTTERLPVILDFSECDKINDDAIGSAVIVASCISNGKNLLYLSRALRTRDNLKLIYFVGLARMTNDDLLTFLVSNLTQGKYGKGSNSFHAVETFFFSNDVKDTSWLTELEFLKSLNEYTYLLPKDEGTEAEFFITDRIEKIESSMSSSEKGMANEIFYPSTFDGKPLQLRKNYAFLNYSGYQTNMSQADTYFTISAIVNKVRNTKEERNLRQTDYVRNLIDPNNFNRFNDGIIQASILRAAHVSELSYHINTELSLELKGILETLIKHNKSEQGEALLEFLFAIASGKLSLELGHLKDICDVIKSSGNKNAIVNLFEVYIREVTLKEHLKQKSMFEEIQQLKEENFRLHAKLEELQTAREPK